jgi:hypothetical protein
MVMAERVALRAQQATPEQQVTRVIRVPMAMEALAARQV